MKHEIEFAESAVRELEELKTFVGKKIRAEIKKQLVHQATAPSKNRKCLGNPPAGFEYEPPLWQLRVDEFRVFYDVNEEAGRVYIRAIRPKPPEKRTEDVIQ